MRLLQPPRKRSNTNSRSGTPKKKIQSVSDILRTQTNFGGFKVPSGSTVLKTTEEYDSEPEVHFFKKRIKRGKTKKMKTIRNALEKYNAIQESLPLTVYAHDVV